MRQAGQETANRIEQAVMPVRESRGYELVLVEYVPRSRVLRLFIDREGGVSLDDCTSVSHSISDLLDGEGLSDELAERYTLEVSSPGLDRPLFTLEQFERFSGEQVSLSLYAPLNGRRRFKGRILGTSGGAVRLDQDGTEVELEMGNIAKARLVPDYDSLFLKREET